MKYVPLFLLLFLSCSLGLEAQIDYTAKDRVTPYRGGFRPGTNLGYFPPWTDIELANIAAGNETLDIPGVGIKSIRVGLFEHFVERWGYESRLDIYEHYDTLGLKENTLLVGFPDKAHQDTTFYCADHRSEMFQNMYEPIWDDGENGTPVNDDNYYALYLYRLVTLYGSHVRFWEIWNEPGFDYTGARGWLPPGVEGNWWENDPDPCDYKLRAPIEHYIRVLRISYEVIKTMDPQALVCVSGTGFPSFLDAILRNTDNPDDGSVTPEYPHGGGAYFDVMGFHSYPHFDGATREWSPQAGGFVYYRHSDAAAAGISRTKRIYSEVLSRYGYDGQTYPDKHWIITECNVPRRSFGEFLGSEEAQLNFMTKAYIECLREDILQLHIYSLSEQKTDVEASFEFDLMGLYKKVHDAEPYSQIENPAGIAYKTTSDFLFGRKYDPLQTMQMQIPFGIDGGAFVGEDGSYVYVLWAKTETDRSEEADMLYTFPEDMGLTSSLSKRSWDYSQTHKTDVVGIRNIDLTGTPVFLTERYFDFKDPGCAPTGVSFEGFNKGDASRWLWTFKNGEPSTFDGMRPRIFYKKGGNYEVSLDVFDSAGELLYSDADIIIVPGEPIAAFEGTASGPILNLLNNSTTNAAGFTWKFGDGNQSAEEVPRYTYQEEGEFEILLTAYNSCGASFDTQSVVIDLPDPMRIPFTANDTVTPYNGHFRPGVNIGHFPPWTDEELAMIAAGDASQDVEGAGVKAIRPALYGTFVEKWGYDFRLETYDFYKNLGLEENTLIVGFPDESQRDLNFYCPTSRSEHFANIYTDIWDDGEDGTPINDENYYAAYLYKLVTNYKDHIKFWEIWNEPGLDYTGQRGWLPPGVEGNWWDEDPDPCVYKLRAPMPHYIRVLRISYEVIKALDPEAYVVVSGTGYLSFLDAILRNTDNPKDGGVSAAYPYKGGAYFDVMGFHSYPHFDGSTKYYSVQDGGFLYKRHSDAAADGLMRVRNNMQGVLDQYGYDGQTYPEKHWIITECNIPRRNFNDFIGGDLAQRNFTIKALISGMVNDFAQIHMYALSEQKELEEAGFEFDLMGLYKKVNDISLYDEEKNDSGIAFKTTSDLLFSTSYDSVRTGFLNFPEGVRGAAFKDGVGNYTYVLWAETQEDDSEAAQAVFSFPEDLGLTELFQRKWDFSDTGEIERVSPQQIRLDATPIFLSGEENIMNIPVAGFTVSNNTIGCAPFWVQFEDLSTDAVEWEWSFPGGTPSTSTEQHPNVTYEEPGFYDVSLTISNPLGSDNYTFPTYIEAIPKPEANFSAVISDLTAHFRVDIPQSEFTNFFWDFGDGRSFPDYNPSYEYENNGTYEVQMTPVANGCPGDTVLQVITIAASPIAGFRMVEDVDCMRTVASFINESRGMPGNYEWFFPGGIPEYSTRRDQFVLYTEEGEYEVILVSNNAYGSDTLRQTFLVENLSPILDIDRTLCLGQEIVVNGQVYNEENPRGTELIPTTNVCDSIVRINLRFSDVVVESIDDVLCDGDFMIINNNRYDKDNPDGTERLESSSGCDSLIHVNLRFDGAIEIHIKETLCMDESMEINGVIYDRNNPSGENRIRVIPGCDTLYVVDLEFEQTTTEIRETLCLSQSITVNDIIYDINNPSGREVMATRDGCDSIIIVELEFEDIFYDEYIGVLCAGDHVKINHTIYNEENPTGVEELVTREGCKIVRTINLAFLEAFEETIEESFCGNDEIEVNGTIYNRENPIGTEMLQTINGCDSLVHINLTYNNHFETTYEGTFCSDEFIVINGSLYNEDNPNGIETFTTSSGCDSIVHVNLNFEDQIITEINLALCPGQSLEVNGITYDRQNPTGMEFLSSGTGCDSTILINLIYNEMSISEIIETRCIQDVLEVNGTRYDADNPSGEERLTSSKGCDSLVVIDITFQETFETHYQRTICEEESVEINGTIYDANRLTGIEVMEMQSGCDSIIYIDLTVSNTVETILKETLCIDEVLMINGTAYNNNNPSGTETLTSIHGCDSIVQIDLTFTERIQEIMRPMLCPGEFVMVNGVRYNEQNPVGIEIIRNSETCDSIIIIGLMYPTDNHVSFQETVCAGEGFTIGSTYYTESGSYEQTLPASTGCDSTINLYLNVLAPVIITPTNLEPQTPNQLGQIEIRVQGGLPPYTIQWSNGANTTNLYDIEAGTYTVFITDRLGCTENYTIEVPYLNDDNNDDDNNDDDDNIPGEIQTDEEVKLFVIPNPVSTSATMELKFESSQNEQVEIQILDINGRLLHREQRNLPQGYSRQHLDAPQIPGIYFVRLIFDDGKILALKQIVH